MARWAVIFDTDLHGGLSGLIAIKALQGAREEVARFYSHFEPVRPPAQPAQPVTNPMWLAQCLPQLVQPGSLNVMVIDIPIDVQAPKAFVDALSQYPFAGSQLWFIDHHGHSEWTRLLAASGVFVNIQPTSYDMSLAVPRAFGVEDEELRKWALIAAVGDFDESIADQVPISLEEDVCDYLDPAWKFEFKKIPDVARAVATYGNVGAIVKWILDRNIGPDELLAIAHQHSSGVPDLAYDVKGHVAVVTQEPPTGLAWKAIAKVCRRTNAPVGTIISVSPRGVALIVATNWRVKSRYAPIVDAAVQEVAAGRPVVGHPGARSILCTTREEARQLQQQVVSAVNARVETSMPVSETVRLINETTLARALMRDFNYISRSLAEILDEMRKMYREYLELKRRQVELLERAEGREARYD